MAKSSQHFNYGNNYGIDVKELPFLGEGRQGKVFLLPNNRVIKICKTERSCLEEFMILKSAERVPFFPKTYEHGRNYIIREYIGGVPIIKYIHENGLSERLAHNLIALILSFEALGFTRLDMRLGHIFVQPNETVRVIDPRGSYRIHSPYPRSMLRGLKKLKVLRQFNQVLKYNYPDLYEEWSKKI